MGDENWANVEVWCTVLECHWLWTSAIVSWAWWIASWSAWRHWSDSFDRKTTIVTRLERNSIVPFLTGEMDARWTTCLDQFVSWTSLAEHFVLVGRLQRAFPQDFLALIPRLSSVVDFSSEVTNWISIKQRFLLFLASLIEDSPSFFLIDLSRWIDWLIIIVSLDRSNVADRMERRNWKP